MIHGSSSDPVLIKKIYLKVWSLKEELNAIIQKAVDQKGSALTDEEVAKLKEEYLASQPSSAPGLSVIEGGKGEGEGEEDLEAQMAAAMENPEASEEESSEEPGKGEEEDLEAQMAAAMGGGEGEASAPAGGPKMVVQRGSHNLPDTNIYKGMTVLSELGMDMMFFFSNKSFLEGQSIVIEFQVPKKFVVNAEIHYCRPFNIKSRIISENKLSHRIAARFTFLKEGERTLLRQFLASIEPEVPEEVVAPKKADDGGGGDEFDDLDSLDF